MSKEGRYTIRHTIKMSQYESVVVEQSVLFDIDATKDTVENAFADARQQIDKSLSEDLRRAAQCTSFTDTETYIHDWNEEVYTNG